MKCVECGVELLEENDVCTNCGCPKSYTIKKNEEKRSLEEAEKRREENRKILEELKRIEEEEKEKIEILKQEEKIRIQREEEEERIKKEFQKEEKERKKRIEELKNIKYKIKSGESEDLEEKLNIEKDDYIENAIQNKKNITGKRKLGSLKYSYNEKLENHSLQIIGTIIGIFNIIVGIISLIFSMDLYSDYSYMFGGYSLALIFSGIVITFVFKAFGDLLTANNKQVALLEELLKEVLKK